MGLTASTLNRHRSLLDQQLNPLSETIVEVRDLRKVYNAWSIGGRRRVDALRGVSLHASAGEVFGLLGPNGAGKTTLIKILLGVVKPTGGDAILFRQAVGSSQARRRVGYLPESLRVDQHHTARSALRYYGRLSRMSSGEIQRRSDELLELVGLRGRDRESVRRFSKGMYQRLGLAQALLHDPDLLVLDEPTDGLDPVGRSEVRRVIERLRDAGKTIFLNSHILQEVELVCTRVAILAQGQIRGIGSIRELASANQFSHVDFIVQATGQDESEAAVRTKLAECIDPASFPEITVDSSESPVRFHASVNLPTQADIDRTVDRIRARGLSICHLQIKRPTLEDTFIRLVGENCVDDGVSGTLSAPTSDAMTGSVT